MPNGNLTCLRTVVAYNLVSRIKFKFENFNLLDYPYCMRGRSFHIFTVRDEMSFSHKVCNHEYVGCKTVSLRVTLLYIGNNLPAHRSTKKFNKLCHVNPYHSCVLESDNSRMICQDLSHYFRLAEC